MLRNNREHEEICALSAGRGRDAHAPRGCAQSQRKRPERATCAQPRATPWVTWFYPPFYRPERAKALHECEVLRLCPYRASVDTVMPITQGVATLCPGLWAVALSGRAFNLQGVDSTRLRPKILQPVMVEILPDSYKNIIGQLPQYLLVVSRRASSNLHNTTLSVVLTLQRFKQWHHDNCCRDTIRTYYKCRKWIRQSYLLSQVSIPPCRRR